MRKAISCTNWKESSLYQSVTTRIAESLFQSRDFKWDRKYPELCSQLFSEPIQSPRFLVLLCAPCPLFFHRIVCTCSRTIVVRIQYIAYPITYPSCWSRFAYTQPSFPTGYTVCRTHHILGNYDITWISSYHETESEATSSRSTLIIFAGLLSSKTQTFRLTPLELCRGIWSNHVSWRRQISQHFDILSPGSSHVMLL